MNQIENTNLVIKFVILASRKDLAGMNVSKQLESLGIKVDYLDTESIYSENIDKKIRGDFFIFVSKHKSEKNVKTLTIHAPGNWRKADFGGQIEKVCQTNSFFLKHLFLILSKNAKEKIKDFQVSLEATHHGPYIEKPCCFIEIGSSENEWKNKDAARVIAETIQEAVKTYNPGKNFISAIGVGGPHYCPNFNKIQASKEYALGHIIPEYAMPLTEKMLDEAINKTLPKPEIVILDWKGLGKSEQRQKIIGLVEKTGLKHIKTSDVKD